MNTMKPNEAFEQVLDAVIATLTKSEEIGVRNTNQYRLFLKLIEQDALYNEPAVIAAILSSNFIGVPDGISGEQLDRLAKASVQANNNVYSAILEDLNGNKDLANKVFLAMIHKPV